MNCWRNTYHSLPWQLSVASVDKSKSELRQATSYWSTWSGPKSTLPQHLKFSKVWVYKSRNRFCYVSPFNSELKWYLIRPLLELTFLVSLWCCSWSLLLRSIPGAQAWQEHQIHYLQVERWEDRYRRTQDVQRRRLRKVLRSTSSFEIGYWQIGTSGEWLSLCRIRLWLD